MCGIAGVVNASKTNDTKLTAFIKQATITGVLRGNDSTGLFQVNKNNPPFVHKIPYEGSIFINHSLTGGAYHHADEPGCTIIHHRAATRGSVSADNAHPFIHEDETHTVIGVHNGTLNSPFHNYDGRRFNVDSDFLMYKIYKEGGAKALGSVKGSWATVWWEEDGKLRLATDGDRSLYFAFVKDKNQMLIASEHGMLWWLASRNNIELEAIILPEKNKIHVFDMSGELRKYEMECLEVAPEENFPSTASTHTTWIGTSSSQKFLESVGLKKGDTVSFYPEAKFPTTATRVYGYIEAANQFIPAVMYGATPSAVSYLNECDSAEVSVRTSMLATRPDSTDKEDLVVVSTPSAIVMEDDMDGPEDILPSVENLMKGPNGRMLGMAKWLELTSRGCVCCSGVVMPKDHDKIMWVNDGRDPLCIVCTEEMSSLYGS